MTCLRWQHRSPGVRAPAVVRPAGGATRARGHHQRVPLPHRQPLMEHRHGRQHGQGAQQVR